MKASARVGLGIGPKKIALASFVAVFNLAGCASSTGITATGFNPSKYCGGNFCTVVTAKIDNGACTVSTKGYADKYVAAGSPALWVVDDSSGPLFFADNGIVIDNPGDDFGRSGVQVMGKVFGWVALLPNGGHKPNGFRRTYSINLVWKKPGTQGVACTPVDPIIVNTG